MKIIVRAGGIIRSGPERELCDEYLKRANGLTSRCSLHSVAEDQVELRKCKSRADETQKLISDIPPNSQIIILDERGKDFTSRELSQFIDKQTAQNMGQLYFVIGGADGFEPAELKRQHFKWSLGRKTWPHKLVRVMICEQIYRALSILAGSPYHRD